MDYCLSDGDGSATMWTAPLDTDIDGDGRWDVKLTDSNNDGKADAANDL